MKKFLVLIITLICCVCVLCACEPQKEENLPGNSEARVIGIKLSVKDEIEGSLMPEDGVYVLKADKTYMVEIHMLRTGGSTPWYIVKSGIEFFYSEEVIDLEDCNPEAMFDYNYKLTCLMTDVVTSIKVTGEEFSDEIKVKFVN